MKRRGLTLPLLARLIRWLATLAMVLGAFFLTRSLLVVFGVIEGPPPYGFGLPNDPGRAIFDAHPVPIWIGATLALGATGFGLFRIVQLMRIIESGAIFDRRASRLLSSFAAAIVLRELIETLIPPLLTGVLYLMDGRTPVMFEHEPTQYRVLFVSLVFLLVSKLMAEAHELAEDNAKIV